MKFIEEFTIDWYDNILKSFCRDSNNLIYYCCILSLNEITNDKIYLCIDLKYLKGCDALTEIIERKSFKEDWDKLASLIVVKKKNEAYLLKTKNLRTDQIPSVRYKDNCKWPKKLFGANIP